MSDPNTTDWHAIVLKIRENFERFEVVPLSILNAIASRSPNIAQLLAIYNKRISALNAGISSANLHNLAPMLLKRVEEEFRFAQEAPSIDGIPQGPSREVADTHSNSTVSGREPRSQELTLCRAENMPKRLSMRKIRANQQNALRSTGPRTCKGKQTVSKNALKHGILSNQIATLPGEQREQFEELRLQLKKKISPTNSFEDSLAEDLVSLLWKVRRCVRVQLSCLATNVPNGRWRTMLRYGVSLDRRLRRVIRDLFLVYEASERKIDMSEEKNQWDLLVDGFLWTEVAMTKDDRELRQRCERYVAELQKSFDQTDWRLCLVLDMIVSAVISKRRLHRFESAHLKIAEFNAEKVAEKADLPIREAAHIAAECPPADIVDTIIRCESLRDREIQKGLELLDVLSKSAKEAKSSILRKPPGRAKEGVADKSAKKEI